MNGYKIVLLKAIFMLYKLQESERVCSGICTSESFNAKIKNFRAQFRGVKDKAFFLYRLTKIYA